MIYFDNGSTSYPKAPGLGQAMADFVEQGPFNINRGAYERAFDLEQTVLETRLGLCSFFGFNDPRYVVFTPGITTSLNFFVMGYLRPGDHVIATNMDHNAVLRPLSRAAKAGVQVSLASAGQGGIVEPGEIARHFQENTKAVIMQHGSNVCGAIQPIRKVGAMCRERGVAFAVDTAQTGGTIPVHMKQDNIDFLAFAGHKGLLGPQGIGGFLVSQKISQRLEPALTGGTGSFSHLTEQPQVYPDRFESGTLNLPGIVGLNYSLKWLKQQNLQAIAGHKAALAEKLCRGAGDFAKIAGHVGDKRLGVVSLAFDGIDNGQVAFALDDKYGIMTRVGLHCAPLAHKTLGTYPTGTVRFSFGQWNTEEEVERCIQALREIVCSK